MTEQKPGNISGVELGDQPPQAAIENSLCQLERFLRLRRIPEEELSPRGLRLLDNVIVARIRDLNGLGRKEQVTQIINPPEIPKE